MPAGVCPKPPADLGVLDQEADRLGDLGRLDQPAQPCIGQNFLLDSGRTLRQASREELCALIAELFPDKTHPFAEPFSRFIEEHRSERAVRGETSDGIAFVYYPQSNRGVWYQYAGAGNLVGVGLLGEKIFGLLSDTVAQRGGFLASVVSVGIFKFIK